MVYSAGLPPPDPASEQRIATLRRRWEQERSATASMPLAEEYRRLGRRDEAAEVLETTLKAQPRHTAVQVALGRCRLEVGDPQGALDVLRDVLERDPLQLVANQLVIESLIEAGQAGTAGQRLHHYQALNARDPKIPGWKRRIAAIATTPPPGAPAIALPAAPPIDAEMLFDLSANETATASSLDSLAEDDAAVETLFPQLCTEDFLEPFRRALDASWAHFLAVESQTTTLASELPEPEPAPAAVAATAAAPAATVTLGELYLRQGHVAEAERIFAEVLAQDPANLAAAEGLHALREAMADLSEPSEALVADEPPPAEPEAVWISSPVWEDLDASAVPEPQGSASGVTSMAGYRLSVAERVRLLRRYLKAIERMRGQSVR